jgi:acyl-CoA reductase-like NAD-dependent aldehyde dehydrogenase
MNDSPYGLTASIWTSDYDTASAIGAQDRNRHVFMNRADYLDPACAGPAARTPAAAAACPIWVSIR